MSLSSFVSVQQCRICGSIIPLAEGVQRHQEICRFGDNAHFISAKQMVIIQFPCPIVFVKRESLCSVPTGEPSNVTKKKQLGKSRPVKENVQETIQSFPSSRRKSSLRALEMLRQVNSDDNVDELSEDLDENSSSNDDDDQFNETRKRWKPEKFKESKNGYYGHKCRYCSARYNHEEVLKRHEERVHGEGKESFTCPVCSRMFHTRLVFQSHVKNHEKAEAQEEAFDLWNTWPQKSPAAIQPFFCKCKYCCLPLKNHAMFLSHMKTCHGDRGPDYKYSCTYCSSKSEEFDSMKLLFQHIESIHTKEYFGTGTDRTYPETVKCKICQQEFNFYYIELHMKRIHPEESISNKKILDIEKEDHPFSCAVTGCGANFKNAGLLKHHFIRHLKNNPYACPVPGCNVQCDAQCHLTRHLQLHMGKVYSCDKCGLSFSKKGRVHICQNQKRRKRAITNYQDHHGNMRSHYANLKLKRIEMDDETLKGIIDSGKKKKIDINDIIEKDPVFLEACKNNPEFKSLILRSRASSHKTFKCTDCRRSYESMKNLRAHRTEFHANRPWKCSKCGQTFVNKIHLKKHMKSHEIAGNVYVIKKEDGMWECTECGAKTSYEITAKRHWYLKHNVMIPNQKELYSMIKTDDQKKSSKKGNSRKKIGRGKPKDSDSSSSDNEYSGVQSDCEREDFVVKKELYIPPVEMSIIKIEPEEHQHQLTTKIPNEADIDVNFAMKTERVADDEDNN